MANYPKIRCFLIDQISRRKRNNNMVVTRFSRGGSKHSPFFNIVEDDSRNRRAGRFIERVGFYTPVANEKQERVRLNTERLNYWVSQGAQVSDAVARLVKEQQKAA